MTTDAIKWEAKSYDEAFEKSKERSLFWLRQKFGDVKRCLDEVCRQLINETDFFKSNLFVQEFGEGISKFVTLSSGNCMVAKGDGGGFITEGGFQISFQPRPNGVIYAVVFGHTIESQPNVSRILATVENLNDLTDEFIFNLVYDGIIFAKTTCYLFVDVVSN